MATAEKIKRSVLVIYTGGTIGMEKSENGRLEPASLQTLVTFLQRSPSFGTYSNGRTNAEEEEQRTLNSNGLFVIEYSERNQTVEVTYKVEQLTRIIDSSDITQDDWNDIAKKIQESYTDNDGFVVLHGTDTMVYTASALSFMFENLEKPVVFTGSQIPIYEACTDASQNLIISIRVAAACDIPEVLLYFRSNAFRANRCVKLDCSNFEAFDSPNHHPLVQVGDRIKIDWDAVGQIPQRRRQNLEVCYMKTSNRVGILHLYPGITREMVEDIVNKLDGVVLLSYGAGNVPTNESFVKFLKEALSKGKLVINVTQCLKGPVTDVYQTGSGLADLGVVQGGDMTIEAAFCKLCHVLAFEADHQNRVTRLGTIIRKEMTPQ